MTVNHLKNGIGATFSALAICGCSGNAPQELALGEDEIQQIISQLSVEQKANLVLGRNRGMMYPPDAAPGMPDRWKENETKSLKSDTNKVSVDSLGNYVVTAFSIGRVPGAAADGYALREFNIPVVVYADGPAGVRIDPQRRGDSNTYYCTAFPTGTILAASWDVDAVKRQTMAMGSEAKEYGVDILLAPALNIHRNPLCGRNFEYFSEDPLLAGKIASAYVQGIQSNGVGTSIKHFAANNQETMRNGIDARISERALREIYLKGFEIAVKEASPWTIMSSYNKVNGDLASENKWLLTDVLRGEWGYNGVVMTDWWAEENGVRQTMAGNDLLMPGTQHQYDEIINGIKDGSLDMASLDRNVANILRMISKTPAFAGYKYSNTPDLESDAIVAREVATQGMVLLENKNNALPLSQNLKVAVFGTASYDTYVGGSGSGNVNRKYKISVYEGVKNAGYSVEPSVENFYLNHIAEEKAKTAAENFWTIPTFSEVELQKLVVENAMKSVDVAIMTISRMAGEGGDRKLVKGDYYLSDTEVSNMNLICDVAHQQGKKVILLLNMGSIVDLTQYKDIPDAILHIWMPGQEAGNAVADVISGKVCPSGKLPLTWAKSYADYSSSADFPLSAGEDRIVHYKEDVFVGYRHFDTNDIEALYPFGYGLSYTSFEYSDLKLNVEGGDIVATVTIKNVGSVGGRESVQLYVSAPASGIIDKPKKELKAFAKTSVIKPGESETLTMKLSKDDLASFDNSTQKWVVDKGEYIFSAAASVTDVRQSIAINIE